MPARFNDYLRDDDEEETPTGQWLITFADMSLLMLTFFILLFSLSSMDTQRFGEISEAMRENLGTEKAREGAGGEIPQAVDDQATLDAARLQRELIERQSRVFDSMRTYLNQKSVDAKIGAIFDNGVITLRLPGDIMFEPGQVELTEEASGPGHAHQTKRPDHQHQRLHRQPTPAAGQPLQGQLGNLLLARGHGFKVYAGFGHRREQTDGNWTCGHESASSQHL